MLYIKPSRVPRVKQNWLVLITLFCFINNPLRGQEKGIDSILTSFDEYSSSYREAAYCHLNKSTFIVGEMLGFSGYIFDKDLKIPSKMTKNLYCVITDKNDQVVKRKLVKVDNGYVNNIFVIDSTFTSGNYIFKAYTNWMRNFDEPNAFVESFKIIDPNIDGTVKNTLTENILDVQFLSEGGHFIDQVKTNVGVIIKNTKGYGVSDVTGTVYDSDKKPITTFRTNSLGIGKFMLYPELGKKYLVRITHFNKPFEYVIDDFKSKGISINVNNSLRNLVVQLNTNERTLEDINGKEFKLTIHNGSQVNGIPVIFYQTSLVKAFERAELYTGINIITLFDENNKPILERMIFNYENLKIATTGPPSFTTEKDSMQIRIPVNHFTSDMADDYNLSISVLPEKTESYKRHHNIISHTYLQPYVRSYIENAQYYFTDIDSKKKYDLDKLLMTQGWSSYNWTDIFNNNVSDRHVFEDGIVLKANKNGKDQKDFIVFPLQLSDGLTVNLEEGQNSFVVPKLYPLENETLNIGALNKKGKAKKPDIYSQFFPSKLPDYPFETHALPTKRMSVFEALQNNELIANSIKDTQVLDEVVVKADIKKAKIEKLKNDAFYRVDVFDDAKRRMNLTFANYINGYVLQYQASEYLGQLSISRRNPSFTRDSIGGGPAIYLDDMLMTDTNYFYAFYMNNVDYIAINPNGFGEGFLGSRGVIKIYTSLDYIVKNQQNPFEKYKFPLAFSEEKKFYVPKYNNYNSDFFIEYGVIDWLPSCKLDKEGYLNFTIHNPGNNNLKLFIEGATENGDLVSEIKTLITNEN